MAERITANRRPRLRRLLEGVLTQKVTVLIVIVFSMFSSLISLVQPFLVERIIDAVQSGRSIGYVPWYLTGLVLVGAIVGGFVQYLVQKTAETAVRDSRRRLVGHMLRLPIPVLDVAKTGDLVSRVGSDTTKIRDVLSQGLIESVAGVFTLVGALVAMLVIDPLLVAATSLTALLAVVMVVCVTRHIEKASLAVQRKLGELTSQLDRALKAIRTIRVSNATIREEHRIDRVVDDVWIAGLKVARTTALVSPISSVAMQISLLVVLGVGGLRVASGGLTIAQLVSFVMFTFLLIMPLGQIFGTIGAVGEALGGVVRLSEITDTPIENEGEPSSTGVKEACGEVLLELVDVSFGYDSDDTNSLALQDVGLVVKRGQKIAIVGPSGAGKTTILDIIARFYSPLRGTLKLDSVPYDELSLFEVRSRMAYVEQEAPLLSGTIRDNVTMNAPSVSDERIINMLRKFGLIGLVERTPKGLDADVGEQGLLLSGGERQRLALVRALLGNPDLLLLDEPTSNLDGANERLVQRLIDRYAQDCALVVVAHRLSTVMDANSIVVLCDGQVEAVGSHEELMRRSSTYRHLVHVQSIEGLV